MKPILYAIFLFYQGHGVVPMAPGVHTSYASWEDRATCQLAADIVNLELDTNGIKARCLPIFFEQKD